MLLGKREDVKELHKQNCFTVEELYRIYKNTKRTDQEIEQLLETTTSLMQQFPTEMLVQKLHKILPPESPIVNYRKRIHRVYRNKGKIVYKVKHARKRCLCFPLMALFILGLIIFFLGAILETGYVSI
eukprot:TRINITY_DN4349_c0_g1_i7.p1 TRINITY_DN4349_c0_g1~~TRINITY_DN4349_c0_g1_i7.p1  ORF type:complete len:128 (-),score=6.36 TRINITY_DN4349_c0_g1_i7:162-545(-)